MNSEGGGLLQCPRRVLALCKAHHYLPACTCTWWKTMQWLVYTIGGPQCMGHHYLRPHVGVVDWAWRVLDNNLARPQCMLYVCNRCRQRQCAD